MGLFDALDIDIVYRFVIAVSFLSEIGPVTERNTGGKHVPDHINLSPEQFGQRLKKAV